MNSVVSTATSTVPDFFFSRPRQFMSAQEIIFISTPIGWMVKTLTLVASEVVQIIACFLSLNFDGCFFFPMLVSMCLYMYFHVRKSRSSLE